MKETKTGHIERLKKNLCQHGLLPAEDKAIMDDMLPENLQWLCEDGEWNDTVVKIRNDTKRYRINNSYQPEPDKPVFPGYELYEVKPSKGGYLQFRKDHYSWGLSSAPNHGCCGYVFKERLGIICGSPIAWAHSGDLSNGRTKGDDGKPATLGWVCFKEDKK